MFRGGQGFCVGDGDIVCVGTRRLIVAEQVQIESSQLKDGEQSTVLNTDLERAEKKQLGDHVGFTMNSSTRAVNVRNP